MVEYVHERYCCGIANVVKIRIPRTFDYFIFGGEDTFQQRLFPVHLLLDNHDLLPGYHSLSTLQLKMRKS